MRLLFLMGLLIAATVNAADAPALFQQHCAVCHGIERIGITGPALLPQSLERLRKPEALKVIREGRVATQMLGFAEQLSNEEIAALGEYIYSAVLPAPTFVEADIRASRVVHVQPGSLPAKPSAALNGRDLMNLFLVVETGDHHVSVLDGDKLDVVERFPTRYALHGGPKFTADGRFVFFASRDGWVSKYDIWNLTMVAEIRVGLNTRNVAVSADGKHVIAANYLPGNLVLLDGDLNLVKVIAAQSLDGKESSRVSAVYEAGVRKSFIAAMKDLPEIWEISFDPATTGNYLTPARTRLEDVLDDFYFDPTYAYVMGASRAGKAQVVNLDQRKRVADLDMSGMPHLGSGISFEWQGQRVMASPNLKEGSLSIIDMQHWRTIKRIETAGPGFFVRGHEKSPYFWADAMMSKEKHRLEIFDKRTLAKAGEVSVEPGKTLAHVEFDRYGKFVLASLWERQSNGGALIVYDATSFKELKRLPMDKPVGKYNLYNKINRSEGTSH